VGTTDGKDGSHGLTPGTAQVFGCSVPNGCVASDWVSARVDLCTVCVMD